MKIIYNKETDLGAIVKIYKIISREIVKIDPSFADELGEELTLEKLIEQLKAAEKIAPAGMILIIETDTEIMVDYDEKVVEAIVDFIEEVTPLIMPIAKTFFDLIELCTGTIDRIKEAADHYVLKFVSRVTRGEEQ